MRVLSKLLFLFLLLIIVSPTNAYAAEANFYLNPANGNFAVGQIFSVSVDLLTPEIINAAAASLHYPDEYLSLESVSTAGSIFSLWPNEPAQNGNRVAFTGGLPDPGFSGDSGRMITLTFRVKKSGTAKVNFISGSMHANDGAGTNILNNMIGGTYILLAKAISPDPRLIDKPSKPVVKSTTHPYSNIWYQNNDLRLEWLVPSGVNSLNYEFNEVNFTIPKIDTEVIAKQKYYDLADGVWYFHLRFKNQSGYGDVAHFKANIDITPPDPFEIVIVPDYEKLTSPTIAYQTTDNLSGIDYYEIVKGLDEPIIVKEGKYQFIEMVPGNYKIKVIAVDKAGNKFQATKNISITSLKTPIIKEYEILFNKDEQFYVNGEADKEVKVKIFIETAGKNFFDDIVQSDNLGNFIYIYQNKMPVGKYKITAQAFDNNGNFSKVSEPISLEIRRMDYLFFSKMYLNYVLIGGTLLTLLLLLFLFILWFRRRDEDDDRKINQEMEELQQSIDFGFATLRQDILTELDELTAKKRREQITQNEEQKLYKLKIDLDVVEGYIKKELKDVKDLCNNK